MSDLITGTNNTTEQGVAAAVSSPVEEVLAAITARADLGEGGTGLVPTDESPGDDPLDYPFSFSNHVLLWHTLNSLRVMVAMLLELDLDLRSRLLAQCMDLLVSEEPRRFLTTDGDLPMFSYVTDGRGAHTLYHDANDVPTVLFPQWMLEVNVRDELRSAWHNTMAFAFSPRNSRGYATGGRTSLEEEADAGDLPPFAGLGSVHSPGAWPLGYFQELRYALSTEDLDAARSAWRRIQGAMQWDGTFCEAVDVTTGECTSKAWFGWPGAMIADLLVKIRAGETPDLLD